jgi:hypothetical protein
MKKITQKQFITETNIPSRLVRAVIRQIGGWQSFKESAEDICRGGIDGGFHGFIYNRDTEAFAKRNRRDIVSLATCQAEDFGEDVIDMVRNFNCLKGQRPTSAEVGEALYAGWQGDDSVNVLNVLAWYAGEEVAREYCRLTE